MNSFLIKLNFFFCQTKISFAKLEPSPVSKIKLFVRIVDSWKLLFFVASSLDPPLLNYEFQRTDKDCSNQASLMVYANDGELFSFLIQTQNVIRISMKLFRNSQPAEKSVKDAIKCFW